MTMCDPFGVVICGLWGAWDLNIILYVVWKSGWQMGEGLADKRWVWEEEKKNMAWLKVAPFLYINSYFGALKQSIWFLIYVGTRMTIHYCCIGGSNRVDGGMKFVRDKNSDKKSVRDKKRREKNVRDKKNWKKMSPWQKKSEKKAPWQKSWAKNAPEQKFCQKNVRDQKFLHWASTKQDFEGKICHRHEFFHKTVFWTNTSARRQPPVFYPLLL